MLNPNIGVGLRADKIARDATDLHLGRVHGRPRHPEAVVGDAHPALDAEPVLARGGYLVQFGPHCRPAHVQPHCAVRDVEAEAEVNALFSRTGSLSIVSMISTESRPSSTRTSRRSRLQPGASDSMSSDATSG